MLLPTENWLFRTLCDRFQSLNTMFCRGLTGFAPETTMTAPIFPKILALPEMRVQAWQVCDDVLTLTIRCLRRKATCPVCGAASTRVHGRYRRQIQDLPCHGRRVCLDVAVRRFRCGNPTCHQQTFAETLPMVARHQRRSRRVQSALGQVGLALGGAAGARLLGHFGMAVCGDTILRTLTRMSGGQGAIGGVSTPGNRH